VTTTNEARARQTTSHVRKGARASSVRSRVLGQTRSSSVVKNEIRWIDTRTGLMKRTGLIHKETLDIVVVVHPKILIFYI
jgi:hypothetical protein